MYYKIKKMLIDMLKFNLITATQRKFRLSYRSQYKKKQAQPTISRCNDAPLTPTLPPNHTYQLNRTRHAHHSTTKPHISIESYKTRPPDYNHHQLAPHYLHRADNHNDGR